MSAGAEPTRAAPGGSGAVADAEGARQRWTPPRPLWREPEPAPPDAVAALASALRAPRVVAEILVRRGFSSPEAAKAFLRPRLDQFTDPWALPDVGAAVERLRAARARNETVLVHGDYDVDGVCGTALLVRALRESGIRAEPFVPRRLEDGYDLGPAGLAAARAIGARCILTCDCGTTAIDAAESAHRAGLDLIVTDHHVVGERAPRAVAFVNPMRAEPPPAAPLCGTGVAYKLLEAWFEASGRGRAALYKYLDLVAIATVADQVPLVGENRAFVRLGLRLLRETRNPGLRALLDTTGLAGRPLSARHAAFVFGPRLNAAGRMGLASRAVELLLTRDDARAQVLARELDRENRERQDVDRRTFREAMAMVERECDPDRDWALVLASPDWHPGVIGIVASRIVERVYRPTVLVALEGERGRGSGRSIPGFHLYDALRSCARHLLRFGGHRAAAGLEVRASDLEGFRVALGAEARARLCADDLVPVLGVDAELRAREATSAEVWRFVRHMAPFGLGNPTPLFAVRGALVEAPVELVATHHLRFGLVLEPGAPPLPAIAFGAADRADALRPAARVDVLVRLQERRRGDECQPEAVVVDLRPATP
jgi:single-stranded-DNA-specific exonuclease